MESRLVAFRGFLQRGQFTYPPYRAPPPEQSVETMAERDLPTPRPCGTGSERYVYGLVGRTRLATRHNVSLLRNCPWKPVHHQAVVPHPIDAPLFHRGNLLRKRLQLVLPLGGHLDRRRYALRRSSDPRAARREGWRGTPASRAGRSRETRRKLGHGSRKVTGETKAYFSPHMSCTVPRVPSQAVPAFPADWCG